MELRVCHVGTLKWRITDFATIVLIQANIPCVSCFFFFSCPAADVNVAQAPDDNKFGCKPLDSSTFDGKVALVKRGECTFVEKAKNAQVCIVCPDKKKD